MKLLLVLVALLGVALQAGQAAPADKVDCAKLDEVLDDLGGAQGMTTMNDKYKIPTNADEQSKRCVEMADAIKQLRKYNKECFSSLTQQVFSAILRTRSDFNEARCKDPNSAEFKEALAAAQCTSGKAYEATKEAEKKTIALFQTLYEQNIADEKLRVRSACCAVIEAKKLFLAGSKDKCAQHEKVYADYVDSFTNEAMGLICPEADKLECAKLERIKIEGVVPKNTFFLNPMIKIVKTLDH